MLNAATSFGAADGGIDRRRGAGIDRGGAAIDLAHAAGAGGAVACAAARAGQAGRAGAVVAAATARLAVGSAGRTPILGRAQYAVLGRRAGADAAITTASDRAAELIGSAAGAAGAGRAGGPVASGA